MAKINVKSTEVTIIRVEGEDYISLTDIAKFKTTDPNAVIGNWMRNRNTIEFLGIWETLYNPNFKPLEFEGFKKEAGLHAFTLSPQKWADTTCAIGIVSISGRYGGTFAHKDIAFKFASWISIEFELYIVKEFQRLKEEEQKALGWSAKRELAKINYHIHTDAIKQNLIPAELTPQQVSIIYA
ncbi:MAG: KilA-N domain-containing protein, partial [Tannerellaceae bacterium]|nr:KilA-N domain-containing protein [Tannerellaceae bacterium]